MSLSFADQIVHTTVRIETRQSDGKGMAGTGFLMQFSHNAEHDDSVLAIVTAKHVIKDAAVGVFHMTLADEEDKPIRGSHVPVPILNFESQWIPHPDPNIDLAAMPLGPVVKYLNERGEKPYLIPMSAKLIADAAYMQELNAVENVLMVGYPNGLWDSHNNYPMTRQGITATPPYADFEGRPEFVIDCACFPGSSGSPVLLFSPGTYHAKNGGVILGGRVKLLGVLWGGPEYQAEGEIRIIPIATKPIAVSSVPFNLGYCIKAEQLMAFESIFEKLAAPERNARNEKGAQDAA